MNQQTTRPQSATEILRTASETLGERGKQYDPAGKQERSMTAIVAAFNAIYPRNLLTVHMGWQFMSLVKMVRGATKPHADSALDQVAFAALAAEEVANQFVQPAALCEDEGCPHHGTPHVCVTSVETPAQHNTNFYFDKTNGCIAANESMTAKFQAERKANVAMHKEVTRLRGKVQELADLAEYRDKRNAELCAELESQRGSQEFKDALVASTRARLNAQEEVIRLKSEATEARKRGSAGYNKQVAIQAEIQKELDTVRQELHTVETTAASLRNSLQLSEQAAETQRGKCIAQSSRTSELQTLVDNLRADLAQATKDANSACAELSSAQDEILSLLAEKRHLTARNKELEDKVQSLNNEVEAKVRELMSNMSPEAPCAHNTDEPKAPRTEYVDPFDCYGDIRSPMHRTVGGHDPARGGLAYPNGKPL